MSHFVQNLYSGSGIILILRVDSSIFGVRISKNLHLKTLVVQKFCNKNAVLPVHNDDLKTYEPEKHWIYLQGLFTQKNAVLSGARGVEKG